MLITVSSCIEIVALVLDIIGHKNTTKKEKFKGGLKANYSRKTAVLRDLRWQTTPERLQF